MKTPQTSDRKYASSLNPLISQCASATTLEYCADTVRMLGLLISKDEGGIDLTPMFWLTEIVARALEWENGSRNWQEAGHD